MLSPSDEEESSTREGGTSQGTLSKLLLNAAGFDARRLCATAATAVLRNSCEGTQTAEGGRSSPAIARFSYSTLPE